MGGLFSSMRFALVTLKALVDKYETLSKRISLSPGIPQLNSSVPYWTVPLSPIAQHGRDKELPLYADVVIIGSGISGTSIAKALLEHVRPTESLQVVMLEARDACSGATARNGGHITPNIYNEYFDLKKAFGASVAHDILRFRLAHISSLIDVARDENLLNESQARIVDNFDAFMHPELFEKSRNALDAYLKDVPKDLGEGFDIIRERETLDKLQLATSILGCIGKPAASIHPYRLVTGLLSKLLARYPNFQLYTRTPCTSIASNSDTYIVATPRGDVRTPHVIHATNAWSSHLLPGMRRKIIPTRAHMSAQRPGKGLTTSESSPTPNWTGSRSFVFYPSKQDFAFDYLTQLLPPSTAATTTTAPLPTAGEFMFGGGAMLGGRSESVFMDNVGIVDDGVGDFEVEAYLCGALERYFSDHWGQEGNEPDTEATNPPTGSWGRGRVKASWTGIIALSADMQPWVGRVPESVAGRKEPKLSSMLDSVKLSGKSSIMETGQTLAKPGEWICAGYTGEGMVHAWLSGQALARMVLDVFDGEKSTTADTPDLPAPFIITEKRVKEARIEDLMQRVGG